MSKNKFYKSLSVRFVSSLFMISQITLAMDQEVINQNQQKITICQNQDNKVFCNKKYRKKEKEMHEICRYKFFGGNFDESKINEKSLFRSISNAGLRKEDFYRGKYAHPDCIYVRSFTLQNKYLSKSVQEMKETIFFTLKRVTEPYAAFVVDLHKNVPYTLEELGNFGGRNSFFQERRNEALSKLYVPEENRIYVVYRNDRRKILDLHGLSLNEAKQKVICFINKKYDNFETGCSIITGRGNHINSSGTSGVINKNFIQWIQEPQLKPYVQNVYLVQGGGMYKVKLNEHKKIKFTKNNTQPKQCNTQPKQKIVREERKQELKQNDVEEKKRKVILCVFVFLLTKILSIFLLN